MNENERKVVVQRMLLLIAVACIIMGLYTFRLIFLQLVNGDSFKAKATNTTDYKFTVTAARGNIVDSTGKRIATTSTGYNVVLNKLQMGDQDLDTMLQQIVELLRKNDEKWLDTLLISEPDAAGNYTFTDSADSTSDQKTLADMKETLGLQQYATANDVMEMLVEKNHLESFSLPWQRVHPLRDGPAGFFQREQLCHGGKRQSGDGGYHQGAFSHAAGRGDCGDQHPQLRAGRYPPRRAGACGQDHRRKVEGDRRKRSGDLSAQGKRL